MSGLVPVEWPDVQQWLIDYLPTVLPPAGFPNTFVRKEKPSITSDPALVKPYRHLIVSVFPGATITAVSRYVRVTFQAWSVKANGLADLADARALAGKAGYLVESAGHVGTPLVFAEIDSGPSDTKDSISGIEYEALTLLLEVGAL